MKQLFLAILCTTTLNSVFCLQKETIFSAANYFCDDYTSTLNKEDKKILLQYIVQRKAVLEKRKKRFAKLNEQFHNTQVLDLNSAHLKAKTFLKMYIFSYKLDKKLQAFDAVWNDILQQRSPELKQVHAKLLAYETHIPKPTSFLFTKLLMQTHYYCKKKSYYLEKCLNLITAQTEQQNHHDQWKQDPKAESYSL